MADAAIAEHLGGHQGVTWLDQAVLDYLIARYGVASMLDVGCGPGGMADLALARGVRWLGIDGDPRVGEDNRRIVCHDYTRGPYLAPTVDLVWCVEFVEHVEAIYVGNFLATFAAGRVLFLTAAWPGQGGHHHVNEQPASYWVSLVQRHGWTLDEDATAWVRANGDSPFARMTGMVFTKIAPSS